MKVTAEADCTFGSLSTREYIYVIIVIQKREREREREREIGSFSSEIALLAELKRN